MSHDDIDEFEKKVAELSENIPLGRDIHPELAAKLEMLFRLMAKYTAAARTGIVKDDIHGVKASVRALSTVLASTRQLTAYWR